MTLFANCPSKKQLARKEQRADSQNSGAVVNVGNQSVTNDMELGYFACKAKKSFPPQITCHLAPLLGPINKGGLCLKEKIGDQSSYRVCTGKNRT